jgi:hypothetical protein
MTMTSLVFCLALVAQEPARGPATAPPAAAAAPGASSRAERAALIAKRKAARQEKARSQALRRAAADRQEAQRRDEELKMAPLVANQIELARLRAQERQNAITGQALMNLQAIEAARLANERYAVGLQYWESQQPIRVIIDPQRP